jgi:hypothetical protein
MPTRTTAWANNIYNLLNRATAPPALTAIYLRLCTADPGATGTIANEVTGGSYTGQNIVSAMGAPTNGVGTSTAAITFTAMPAVTVTHWAKCKTATGTAADEVIEHGPLAAPVVVPAGQAFTVSSGDLDATAA